MEPQKKSWPIKFRNLLFGKNQLSAKYYNPAEDDLYHVLFLNGDKVAKYYQDAVEGWEVIE